MIAAAGPRPYRVNVRVVWDGQGRAVAGRVAPSRSQREHVAARTSGARVPGERRAERERRGAAEAQGQAAGSPHDRAAGDRLIVKTDPQLMLNPQRRARRARGTPHGRSGQTQSGPADELFIAVSAARARSERAESC